MNEREVEIAVKVRSEVDQIMRDLKELRREYERTGDMEAIYNATLLLTGFDEGQKKIKKWLAEARRAKDTNIRAKLVLEAEEEFERLSRVADREAVQTLRMEVKDDQADQAVSALEQKIAVLRNLMGDLDIDGDATQYKAKLREIELLRNRIRSEVLEIRTNVRGSEAAQNRLAALLRDLNDVDGTVAEARVEIDAQVDRAKINGQISQVLSSVGRLRSGIGNLRVGLDASDALSKARQLEADLNRRLNVIRKIRVETDVDDAGLAKLDRLESVIQSAIARTRAQQIEIKTDMDISDAERKAADLGRLVSNLKTMSAEIDIKGDPEEAKRAISTVRALMSRLGGQVANLKMQMQGHPQVIAAISNVERELKDIDGETAKMRADLDAGGAMTGFKLLDGLLKKTGGTLSGSFSNSVRQTSVVLTMLRRVLIVLAVAALAPLIGAVLTLAAGFTMLAGAAGLAAAAFAPSIMAVSKHKTESEQLKAAQDAVEDASLRVADAERALAEAEEEAIRSVQKARESYQQAVQEQAKAEADAAKAVTDAIKQYDDAVKDLARTQIEQNERVAAAQRDYAESQRSYAQAQVEAQQMIQDAVRSLADAEQDLADARASAAREIADAEEAHRRSLEQLQRTHQEVARNIADAYNTYKEALEEIGEVQEEVARQNAAAYQSYQDSIRDLAETQRQARMDVADAIQSLRDAEVDLARTREEVARSVASAHQDYREAVAAIAEAEEEARDQIRDAIRAHQDAIVDLADTQREAEERIQEARENARQAVERIADAEYELFRAREQLAESARELTQAQVELNRAMRDEPLRQAENQLEVDEARQRSIDLAYEVAAAEQARQDAIAAGDMEAVIRQQNELANLALQQRRNAIDLERAERALEDQRAGGTDELQRARSAVEQAWYAQRDAIRSVQEAEHQLLQARAEAVQAQQQIAVAQAEAARMVAEAQQRVADTARAVRDAQVEGAERIAAAHQRARESYEQYRLAQQQGAYQIQDAQRRVAEATQNVAETERSAALRVQEARRNVSEQYQQYVLTVQEGAERIADAEQRAKESYDDYLLAREQGAYQIQEAERAVADTYQGVVDAHYNGSRQIIDAEQGVIDANAAVQQAYIDASELVRGAYLDMEESARQLGIAERDRSYAIADGIDRIAEAEYAIDEARAEGQYKIATAQENTRQRLMELQATQAQADRDVAQAQRDLATAIDELGEADRKLRLQAQETGAQLTHSQQMLKNSFEEFKKAAWGFVDEMGNRVPGAFSAAQEQLDYLGVEMLNVGMEALPYVGQVAYEIAIKAREGINAVIEEFRKPIPQSQLQTLFDNMPAMVEKAIAIAGNVGQIVVGLLAPAVPFALDLMTYIQDLTEEFAAYLQTAEGQQAVTDLLESAKNFASEAAPVVGDLLGWILEIGQSPGFEEFVSNILNLLSMLADNGWAVNTFFEVITAALDMFTSLPEGLQEFVIQVGALVFLFNLFGGGAIIAAIGGVYSALAWLVGVAMTEKVKNLTKSLWGLVGGAGPLAALAGLAAIAIVIYMTWDSEEANAAYDKAISEGEGVGIAWMEWFNAGVRGVPILGTIAEWASSDAVNDWIWENITKWFLDPQITWAELGKHVLKSIVDGFLGEGTYDWIAGYIQQAYDFWTGDTSWTQMGINAITNILSGLAQLPYIGGAFAWALEFFNGAVAAWEANSWAGLADYVVTSILSGLAQLPIVGGIFQWILDFYNAAKLAWETAGWAGLANLVITTILSGLAQLPIVGGLFEWILGFYEGAYNAWQLAGWEGLAYYVITTILGALAQLPIIGGLFEWILGFFQGAWAAWQAAGWEGLAYYVITSILSGLAQLPIVGGFFEWILGFFQGAWNAWQTQGWSGLAWYAISTILHALGIYDIVTGIVSFVTNFYNTVMNYIHNSDWAGLANYVLYTILWALVNLGIIDAETAKFIYEIYSRVSSYIQNSDWWGLGGYILSLLLQGLVQLGIIDQDTMNLITEMYHKISYYIENSDWWGLGGYILELLLRGLVDLGIIDMETAATIYEIYNDVTYYIENSDWYGLGGYILDLFLQGLVNLGIIDQGTADTISQIYADISYYVENGDWWGLGEYILDALIGAVTGGAHDFDSAIQWLYDMPGNLLDWAWDAFWYVGEAIIYGIWDGFLAWGAEAAADLLSWAQDVYWDVNDWLETGSPSKLFMRLFETVPQGAALGIEREGHLAVREARNMSEAVADAASIPDRALSVGGMRLDQAQRLIDAAERENQARQQMLETERQIQAARVAARTDNQAATLTSVPAGPRGAGGATSTTHTVREEKREHLTLDFAGNVPAGITPEEVADIVIRKMDRDRRGGV